MITVSLPTTVFLVRHAEVYNPLDILYGRLPRYRLSELGKAQAKLTARFLGGRQIDAIYTSPLLRARQTAAILAQLSNVDRVRKSRALIEVGTSYQGSPNSILKPGFSFYDPVRDPNDESMTQIFHRMFGFMQTAARRHAGGAIVLVSHADPITILRVGLEGLDFTSENLHSVVYAQRASITQVRLRPSVGPELSYFDVAALHVAA